MFGDTSAEKRQMFVHQTDGAHIPGYTGHCPTLRFQFGTSYGSRTKEIISDLKQKRILSAKACAPYRLNNHMQETVIRPMVNERGRTAETAPRFIIGYTGFIPNMNFRSGRSYSRTADDCMNDFIAANRHSALQQREINKMRPISVPKLAAIRNDDNVAFVFSRNANAIDQFKVRDVSPESPPIAGYTGYIPKMKGNEESLAQRYNNVVKRSLTLLREERDRHSKLMRNVKV